VSRRKTMSDKTDTPAFSAATLEAALGRAVPVEGRHNGKLVFSAGMSEEEREIRLYDASWDEGEARALLDGLVASCAVTREDADAYLEYLVKKAAWCRKVVENLDAERAARTPEAPAR
jgi:hypothetical protein